MRTLFTNYTYSINPHRTIWDKEQERAFLADRLLSSLDGDISNDIDSAWIAEAERRYTEYKDSKRKGIPAQDVFTYADRILN